ncbi:hypothetical protein BLA39750_02223 [Burkholderia lata]|uniref:Uncharacterized protein n=1 Tax=Burkholderia lata (strain ATCC 17760 / DSM 23089 / LMG 22485 / NCIMB 9086 / R18194 / 383) TaxID=482957 RepID=A0A6P2W5B2_BURL3|nr:hypothetical protein [Burkholderia lata]VWC95955.1 hypothetical protein BLA39750_02223 [Burkholderia lata]
MAILETTYADQFQGVTQNYLYDWARRTGNLGSLASYYVEARVDGDTGRPIYNIRPIADQASAPSIDGSDPLPINQSPGDATVTAETNTLT